MANQFGKFPAGVQHYCNVNRKHEEFANFRKQNSTWNNDTLMMLKEIIFYMVQVWTFSVLGDRIYVMRCLFVAVGLNACFIVLPHWDNMS